MTAPIKEFKRGSRKFKPGAITGSVGVFFVFSRCVTPVFAAFFSLRSRRYYGLWVRGSFVVYTLGQASKIAKRSKTTIHRAIKAGRLPALRNEAGVYAIDEAELIRAFPVDQPTNGAVGQSITDGLLVAQAERDWLQTLSAERLDQIADLRRRLDAETEERRRLTVVLTDYQGPATKIKQPPVPWLRRVGRWLVRQHVT